MVDAVNSERPKIAALQEDVQRLQTALQRLERRMEEAPAPVQQPWYTTNAWSERPWAEGWSEEQ